MAELSDEELLDALGIDLEAEKKAKLTPRQERIIAGFEDIQRFVEENGHPPRHGEGHDIFERMYAVRLDRLNDLDECRELLLPLDHQKLLSEEKKAATDQDIDDEELLAELGVEEETAEITDLRYVRSNADRRAAEEVANRQQCEDFDQFSPLFEKLQEELDQGQRETRKFELKAEIQPGAFFIVGGQKAYVAEMGEKTITPQGRTDARLRVIFDNGTESNMLMRSLQRALNKDPSGRRITESGAGPLFGGDRAEGDYASGTIYVLRSKSDHPMVAENRDLVHKIGVTNIDVAKRIAGARLQPTFLMADVDVIATYELFNVNRTKLEKLIHRVFSPARLDIEISDRFGNPVTPREWFLVPLFVVDEAVEKIRDGSIGEFVYDPETASLVRHS